MIVTHHICTRECHCANCGSTIRKGQDMLTARQGSIVMHAHVSGTCPVYPDVRDAMRLLVKQ